MKQFIKFTATVCALIISSSSLWGQSNIQHYVLHKQISLPGNGSYDYMYFDQPSGRLYVSHGTSVDVVDTKTDKLIGTIDGMKKVHGVAIVHKLDRGFISDGHANAVAVFDTRDLKKIKTIALASHDPDCIIYDPYSDRIFTFDGDSHNSTVINPQTMEVEKTIDLGGSPEFAVTNGKGKIFNNLEDKNRLNVIDTKSFSVSNTYPLAPCGGPTGLAIDEQDHRLFTVCRQNKGLSVVNAETGKVITTVPIGSGVDAVRYDPETRFIICSNGDGTATVIQQLSADHYNVIQTLETAYHAKTMELDKQSHTIYFSANDFNKEHTREIPGTFKLLVYRLEK